MSLKTFLQDRNNANTLEKAIEHVRKTLETVVEFERGFTIYAKEKNPELALEIFRRVGILESEADTLRRDLLKNIAKSELSPMMRENLSVMVKRIDRIANAADGAGRRMAGLESQHLLALGEEIFDLVLEMIHFSVEATKILFHMMKRLEDEDEKIFTMCEKIQKLEHKCDMLHSHIYEKLNRLEEAPSNHFVAIQISNLVDMIESITDKVEDVSDYIEILKTARY
jgi:predicted phosphate transport protein (TIGR00153 family)